MRVKIYGLMIPLLVLTGEAWASCSCGVSDTYTSDPGANVTISSGQTKCINMATFTRRITVQSGGTVIFCFAGTINFSERLTLQAGAAMNITSGTTVSHTSNFVFSESYNVLSSMDIQGVYEGTSTNSLTLKNMTLTVSGSFSYAGNLTIEDAADPSTTPVSLLTIPNGGELVVGTSSTASNFSFVQNQGFDPSHVSCTADIDGSVLVYGRFSQSGSFSTFELNSSTATMEVRGSDGGGALAFNRQNGRFTNKGSITVTSGTLAFQGSTDVDATDGTFNTVNFTVPSIQFTSGTGCGVINISGALDVNAGSTWIGDVYIWDTSFDQSNDLFGGAQKWVTCCGGCGCPPSNITYSATANLPGSCTPLPVTWLSFTSKSLGDNIELMWTTAVEKESRYFHVYSSKNGVSWTQIATLKANGTTTDTSNYVFLDNQLYEEDVIYYKILQEDMDGMIHPSKIIQQQRSLSQPSFEIIPNPVNEGDLIWVEGNELDRVKQISVYTTQGVCVVHRALFVRMASRIEIQPNEILKGLYVLKIVTDDRHYLKKIVVK